MKTIKVSNNSLIAAKLAAIIALFVFTFLFFTPVLPYSFTELEKIPYTTTKLENRVMELGSSKVEVQGRYGSKNTEYRAHRSILDIITNKTPVSKSKVASTTIKEPVNAIVVMGTKRYQYMHCSDGSYMYYTSEQMQNKSIGYTTTSDDFCKLRNKGVRVKVSDSAPSQIYTSRPGMISMPSITSNGSGSHTYPYPESGSLYSPPVLDQYTKPKAPKIKVSPTKPQAPTCTYYQGNGVCF